jgi:hypothetical protein
LSALVLALFFVLSNRFIEGLSVWLLFLFIFNGSFLFLRILAAGTTPGALKNSDTQFLLVWLLGSLVFVLLATHFYAMRFVIIFLPPMILLLFRLEAVSRFFTKALAVNLFLVFFAAITISWADYHFANSYSKTASDIFEEIGNRYSHSSASDFPSRGGAVKNNGGRESVGEKVDMDSPDPRVWFLGHWGFQYYMEALGAKNLGFNNIRKLRAGDYVVDTLTVHKNFIPQQVRSGWETVREFRPTSFVPIRVMNRSLGAGWYSDIWGPLPFALNATAPLEVFTLYRVTEAVK